MAYTKEDMAKDIVNLLRGEFSDFLKNEAMEKILWAATERRESDSKKAKYQKCKYWSEKALFRAYNVDSIDKVINNTSYNGNNDLRHEHVIPKATMKKCFKEWANDKSLNEDDLSTNILNVLDLAVACVITKTQAAKLDNNHRDDMPDGREDISDPSNTWARYEDFDDTIYEITWEKMGRSWVCREIAPKTLTNKNLKADT